MNISSVLAVSALALFPLFAQSPAPSNTVGTVMRVMDGAFTLKPDSGAEVLVALTPAASVRRVAPGETNLNTAVPVSLTEVAAGDRVLARGIKTETGIAASMVVLMAQSDLAKKQAGERADWDRRGVAGVVIAVSPDSVTIRSRTPAGTAQTVLTAAANASIRRYAPDSVAFSDAKPSSLGQIAVGDQVRARGDKSADGSKVVAQEIVSGAFKTVAALVVSVDAATGEIRGTNLENKKPLVVRVNKDSTMHRLQPPVAQAIALRVHPEWAKGGGAQAPAEQQDLQQLLDRSPNVTTGDLKAGDAIVVSATIGATPDRITAITLLCGVEPILTKPGTQTMSLGSWNLDLGGGIGQ